MRRRLFVGFLAGSVAALSGCLETVSETLPDSPSTNSDWDSATVTVGKTGLVDDVDDEDARIEDALTYWSANGETYLDHPVTFEYDPQASSPGIEIEFVEEVSSCYDDTDDTIAGCAPILVDRSVPDGERIRLETIEDPVFLGHAIKHELGHVLGLNHDDQPAEIMSDDPSDWGGKIGTRTAIADGYREAVETYGTAVSTYQSGQTSLNKGNYSQAESEMLSARDDFESASAGFDRERRRAEEIGKTEAAGILARGRDLCRQYVEASDRFATAAAFYESGTEERARQSYENARRAHEQTTTFESIDGDRLSAALGLEQR